jgi:hypothetical protein
MKILYTKIKTPYIELDENNRIVFHDLSSTDEGYTHLLISGRGRPLIPKKKKAKELEYTTEHISVISTIKFGGTGVSSKLKRMAIYKYIPIVKEKMQSLMKDDIFPKKNIAKLDKILKGITDNEAMEEYKKTTRRKKKAKKSEKRK